jgi:hypothetical protein
MLPSQPATRAVLAAGGMTDAMLRTQLAAGRLVRVRQGVFVGAADWPADAAGQFALRARAEQAAHPEAVISHGAAAAILGLPSPGGTRWFEGPIGMTVEAGSRPFRDGVCYHRTPLPAGQVTTDAAGYRITSAARTAVDLACALEPPQALVLLDAAARQACERFVFEIRRRDYRNPRLVGAARELLSDAARTIRSSRLAPAIQLSEPCRESPIESLAAGHFALAGLPAPLWQEPIRTPAGTFYPDCLWPEHRLIGEADGADKYRDQHAAVREKEREQVLRDLGFRVVRWLGKEIVGRPQIVVERVRRELAAS